MVFCLPNLNKNRISLKVSVLNDGLTEWIIKGLPIEKRTRKTYELGYFKACLRNDCIINYNNIKRNNCRTIFLQLLIHAQKDDIMALSQNQGKD